MGRGGQGTRSKAQGREDWTWNFGLGRRRKALQKEEPLVRKTVLGRGRAREGTGRLAREEADSLFWTVFLGEHSVLYMGLLGTEKGWERHFSVKWFEAVHSSALTSSVSHSQRRC